MKIVYTHQVCLHYKIPFLRLLKSNHGHDVFGIFGQSHWKQSKFRSVSDIPDIHYQLLPTIDLYLPYRKRYAHVFWNPTLKRTLQTIQPDVVITGPSNFPNNSAIASYCNKYNIPYIWHGLGSMYSTDSIVRKFMNKRVRKFIQGAAGGLAFNTDSKRYYVEKYDVDSCSIQIAPNVVDTEKVYSDRILYSEQVAHLKKELNLEGCKVILFVGAIDPVKKLDVLLEAFKKIKFEGNYKTKLLIVGDGTLTSKMKDLCGELGITDSVVFVGKKIIDVNLYYMLGDVFVMPGLGGLAISHAMAHGLPVITAPADGTEKDIIQDGINGFLLDNGQGAEAIAMYLTQLLNDDELLKKMSNSARHSIEKTFNIKNTVSIFDKLVSQVALSR
ncbi:Spore coat protein SA [Novipirellula aureliae]|uniref:Spore coat protein SA n=1 Tax=Novipirellula aureliae TaxID=2527966 RepID=A0A5C6DS98_9BACT|nr:glycosyltransferase family 4 protein [Novipirellula aureliae]TWU37649.1 Spore coat protein SA [Novipirellula aureliae]